MFRAGIQQLLNSFSSRIADDVSRSVVDQLQQHQQQLRSAEPSPGPAVLPPNTIQLDYPTTADHSPRWGWGGGRPEHPGLRALIDGSAQRQARLWEQIAKAASVAGTIAEHLPDDDPRPHWRNPMMAGLDACTIGAFLAANPKRYIEVGSGNSTKFARHFIRALGGTTRITSIDPRPRALCDTLCDEVIRKPAELVEPRFFQQLEPGDVFFFDGSHRTFMNSDVTALFLDVIPSLPPGVIIGVHDIFFPDDYPSAWMDRYYNEQYVLAAYLLGARSRVQVLFATHDQATRRPSAQALAEAQRTSGCPEDVFHGCGFWFTHA